MAGGTPANPAALAGLLFGLGFLDQHHRDSIFDAVQHPALGAPQLIGLLELHFGVAFRAGENFEEFLGDHSRMVVRLAP